MSNSQFFHLNNPAPQQSSAAMPETARRIILRRALPTVSFYSANGLTALVELPPRFALDSFSH